MISRFENCILNRIINYDYCSGKFDCLEEFGLFLENEEHV